MRYNNHIFINISNTVVGITLFHTDAIAFFRDYLLEKENVDFDARTEEPLHCSDQVQNKAIETGLDSTGIAIIKRGYGADQFNARTEFETLVISVSDALIFHSRAVFHGVAFIWKERAWIFAAPSGTGKTTQYRNWKKLWGKEVEVICGDKPILYFGMCDAEKEDVFLEKKEDIIVYPSPWPGKEGYGGRHAAPLAGIIFLEQGERNDIRRMSKAEAVVPIFGQWFTFARTEEQINLMCDLEEELINRVPVWKLTNVGDEDSARLTRHVLEIYLRDEA